MTYSMYHGIGSLISIFSQIVLAPKLVEKGNTSSDTGLHTMMIVLHLRLFQTMCMWIVIHMYIYIYIYI